MSTATTSRVPEWLAHLSTDRRGIPVPYVNLWGPEGPGHEDRLSIGPDRHLDGRRAAFFDDDDQDTPNFTRQHMARQRACIYGGLCQVCGRPVPWSRRFLVVAALSVETIDLWGRPTPVVIEPWLDERCARFALDRCPALIRRTRDEALTLVPITSKREATLSYSVGYLDGPLEAETRRAPVALWAKIILHSLDLPT